MTIHGEFKRKWKEKTVAYYVFPSLDLSAGTEGGGKKRNEKKKTQINVMCPVGNSNLYFEE